MKKLFALLLAGLITLSQSSFSNDKSVKSIENGLGITILDLPSDQVGVTMAELSAKRTHFIPSTTLTTPQLSCLLNHANASGTSIMRLSIVQTPAGNNCLIVNYYSPGSLTDFDSGWSLVRDTLGPALDSTQPCCPKCPHPVSTKAFIIKEL